jgi:ADP-ribosylglycohydrolase
MLGAIAGDIIGSVYESRPIKTTRFPLFHPLCRFTDDTVLTVALADSLMHGAPFVGLLKQYYRAYPHAGYGGSFHQWAPLDDIRPRYKFQVSCQKSVPQAIRAFLESDNFEDAVRKAISLGGDSDTLACMAGGIAKAFYGGVPEVITTRVYELLDDRLGRVTRKFTESFGRT